MHSQDIAVDEAYIPLRNRRREVIGYARVDLEHAATLSASRWFRDHRGYARRSNATNTTYLMHRVILDLGPGDPEVDHINRNPLDNRTRNLRVVTRSQNARNQGPRTGRKYCGVYFDNNQGKWRARIRVDKRAYHIGWFQTETEAGEAADAWSRLHLPERWQTP